MVHAMKAPSQALPGPEEEPSWCILYSTGHSTGNAMKPTLQALEGPGDMWRVGFMLAGSGLAAKALGHSHATCRSGLALNYYAYRKRNSFSWKRRHSQCGSLENETIASIV